MNASYFIGLINLLVVPALPVYLHCKREHLSLRPSLELFFQYGISAALLVPFAKILAFLPGKLILKGTVPVGSGWYTAAALAAALLLPWVGALWQKFSEICKAKLPEGILPRMFFLRQTADPLWPFWKRLVYFLWRIAAVLAAGLLMGAVLMIMAVGPDLGLGLFRNAQLKLLLLNAIPVALLALLFLGITGRAWAGFLLGGGIAFGFSLVNYYKLAFRDDPLIFKDLLLIREARNMVGGDNYSLFIDDRITAALTCLLFGAILLYLLAPGRAGNWWKRVSMSGAALLAAFLLAPTYSDANLYIAIADYTTWVPRNLYVVRGFLYPFLHSAFDISEAPPDGYSQEAAQALLDEYADADIPEDRKISVIAIMREAYADFSRLGIEGLDCSGYDAYHALEAESCTGDLVTNIFAGGTVDTERCFITGNYVLWDFRSASNSYAWYMRDQGYTVEGSHPYYDWYYNRKNVNRYLGFEHYRFLQGDFDQMTDSVYPEDHYLLSEIYSDFLENKSTGKPYFSFSVTMQSHGFYSTADEGNPIVLSGGYSDECRYAVSNYLATIWDCDAALLELVEELRADPDPVVLITFGDHLPSMAYSYYVELGVDFNLGTDSGFLNYYSTRYLIWANDAAKEVLGHDVNGEGEAVSPCFLMNVLFQQLGWEGPAFLQAMGDMMEVFPVVTTNGQYVVDGVMTREIPEARRELFRNFLYLQYDWRNRFLYGG